MTPLRQLRARAPLPQLPKAFIPFVVVGSLMAAYALWSLSIFTLSQIRAGKMSRRRRQEDIAMGPVAAALTAPARAELARTEPPRLGPVPRWWQRWSARAAQVQAPVLPQVRPAPPPLPPRAAQGGYAPVDAAAAYPEAYVAPYLPAPYFTPYGRARDTDAYVAADQPTPTVDTNHPYMRAG